jgi:hypothetical protein
MRGIPYFLLIEYLVELGGVLISDSVVKGEGWIVELIKMEPFQIGSLVVGQTRLILTLEEAFADDFITRFQKKTLRAGG